MKFIRMIQCSLAILVLSGCDNAIKGFISRKIGASNTDSNGKHSDVLNRDIVSNGANFQVKSSEQILRSIEVCLGAGVTTILPEMILGNTVPPAAQVAGQPPPPPPPPAFLDQSFAPIAGKKDVVRAQAIVMDGEQAALRAGVRADGASFPYLTALINIANAVSYNCEKERQSGDKTGLCKCETPEKASELLERCLPNVNNNTVEFKALQLEFAQKCALDRKAALASLIGSYAFAKTP